MLLITTPSCWAYRVYFDIAVAELPIGRLVFKLDNDILPLHAENVRRLCTGEQSAIDPKLTYEGCAFEHGPSYVAGPQYKWSHVLKGRGRNAVGRANELIRDPERLAACVRDGPAGSRYYGLDVVSGEGIDAGIVLTVPVQGPGRGSSRVVVVRVRESPPSWQQRLLLNSAVIGVLEPESASVVEAMASAGSPPIVARCGELL